MLVNFVLAVLKISAGILGGSKALLADGIHSLSDLTADLFVMFSIQISNRPSDSKHSYGYKRYETLGNIIISSVLVLIAIGIGIDAVLHHAASVVVNYQLVLPIALLAILINELTYQFVVRRARRLSSDILYSLAVHQRSDAGTSAVVLMSGLASIVGITFSDQVATLLIALMILYYAIPSILKSIGELLDKGLSKNEIEMIESKIAAVDGVLGFHLLRTRKMASQGVLDVHIVVDPVISVSEGHYVSDLVELNLKSMEKIEDVTVHVDFYDDHEQQSKALPSRKEIKSFLEKSINSIEFETDNLMIHYHLTQLSLVIYAKNESVSSLQHELKQLKYPSWLCDIKVLAKC
jgi:cation diffusion facilitator family transporter